MLIAFSEAGRYLNRPDYIEVAIRNGAFLIDELFEDETLYRSWRNGKASHKAYLEDYAALILGFLALYQSDNNPKWYGISAALANKMVSHFRDPEWGFFDTSDNHEKLILRPKDIQDNATPSGNALAALALLQLSSISGKGDWRDIAEESLMQIQAMAGQYPTAVAQWLCALDFALSSVQEVAIIGVQDTPDFQALTTAIWAEYRPYLVAAISNFPPNSLSPEILFNRPLIEQKATAYVCQSFICKNPVTTPEDLQAQLEIYS